MKGKKFVLFQEEDVGGPIFYNGALVGMISNYKPRLKSNYSDSPVDVHINIFERKHFVIYAVYEPGLNPVDFVYIANSCK